MAGHSSPQRLALAFLSGIVLAASFPKINLPWLAWAAPGLMLWAARSESGKSIFMAGVAAGLGNYLVLLYWLLFIPFPFYAVVDYAGMSIVLALCVGAWCRVCWHLFPTCAGWRGALWPAFCAAAWVAMEMGMTRVLGFPWDSLGVSQFRFLALIQIASVTGVYGVSFLVAWVSVSVLGIYVSGGRQAAWQLAPPLAALAGAVIFGAGKLSERQAGSSVLKVALVQPAIPQRAIWDPAEKTNRFLKLLELSRAALAVEPDLLVWPEAALPDLFTRNGYTQRAVAGLLQSHRAWLVMGAADTRRQRGADGRMELQGFNSAFLINPGGDLVNRYYKRRLVPFAEYLPLARHFPYLARLRKSGAGLCAGDRAVQFHLGDRGATLSPLICYEDSFPREARQAAEAETDFLLDLTNDGWLGNSAAPWQHAISALFRAVEQGLPLARCANNGLTCWIDARGRLHDVYFDGSTDIYQAGFKIAPVPLRAAGQAPTLYRRHGDWFGWGCVAAVMICLVVCKR
ncbi:MAG: apolipoprotein N-acyltransferase [Verrucomicrobiota bacterium]|jgi:apolipoprotein N-acyltransferase